MSTIARVVQSVLLTAIVGLLVAPAAHAGRLIETGHDIDLHCADQDEECHFVRAAVDYVRAGAPNPSKPILVLDRLDLDVSRALVKAYAPAAPPPSTVVDPRSAAFTTTPIDTSHWSAIFVASDITCGGCDLNDFPSGTTAVTADSTAIAARTADIASFFDAGGGILAGAGGTNAGGGTTSFGTTNVPYYSFVATSGAGPVTGPFEVTPLGSAIGITDNDVNFAGCGAGCTHNSFGFPPAGSRLKPAERDPGSGRFITLVEDTDPPLATVVSGPANGTTSTSATFRFTSTESSPGFQCRRDGAPFATCGSTFSVSGLSEGRHEVDVRAVDLVGNVQPTPTAYSWSVCLDRDHDGSTSCSTPPECNDNSATTRPGAREVPGNRIDENCDGFSAPFDRVDASLRYAFSALKSSTSVISLKLSKVTRSARITLTCKGKGCPFKSKKVSSRQRSKMAKLFRKKGKAANLRVGATVRLSITKSGLISKVFSFKVRKAALPSLATQCQLPGSKKLRTTCPVFTP